MTRRKPAIRKTTPRKSAAARRPKGRVGESQRGCLVCGSGNVWGFVEIRGVPIHSNVLAGSRSEALLVPKGDLEMRCCKDCGHVYNAAFSSDKMKYGADYENSLFVSETYRTYAASLAADLIERFGLRGRRVVEIGCGSGEFLKLLCEKGENDGIGFDPSALGGRSIDRHPSIEFVREYYSPKHAHYQADFICCRQVLEHVDSPLVFLREIRDTLPTGKKGGVFFEVPDVMFMLKAHSSWDFIYEHCSYFSMSSLSRLFTIAGFAVLGIWRAFHEQFLCVCAEPVRTGMGEDGATSSLDKGDVLRNAETFSRVFQEQVRIWGEALHSFEKSKAKVVLWGAGSKGVTFLNVVQGGKSVEYVVDINDQKCGRYIPGTGQQIVPPLFLTEYKPDIVILMNPAYEAEVRKTVNGLNVGPRIIVVSQQERIEDIAF